MPCLPRQPLQCHPRPQAAEAPQSLAVPCGRGGTGLGVIKLREIDAERDFWMLQQEVVDFSDAAVVGLVTRREVGIEGDASDVVAGVCNRIQITTRCEQQRFGMLVLVSAVCSMAFLDNSA